MMRSAHSHIYKQLVVRAITPRGARLPVADDDDDGWFGGGVISCEYKHIV